MKPPGPRGRHEKRKPKSDVAEDTARKLMAEPKFGDPALSWYQDKAHIGTQRNTFGVMDAEGATIRGLQVEFLVFRSPRIARDRLTFSLRVGQDRRRWSALRAVAQTYGVHLGQDGCLQVLVAHDHASAGFARMVSAQLAIDAWAREHVGLPHAAQWLIEEASLYLRAWRPQVPLDLDPLPVTDASGDHYRFHASKGIELIDAITPHRNTTSQELRKLVDVRRLASNADLQIRVILDDRRDAESAAKEAAILGSMATTWTMSRLIKAAGAAAATQ